MNRLKTPYRWALGALGSIGLASLLATAMAADHLDSPSVMAEPTADATDLYAWTSADASKLNLVLNVAPFAGSDAAFSDAVQYAFHISSMASYGAEQSTDTMLICQFYTETNIECWLGDEYAEGDASSTAGVSSASGKMRVFAGLRDDPFFFEFNGFNNAVDAVVTTAAGLGENDFNEAGCVTAVDADLSAALVGMLQSNGEEAASDTFAGQNVLSIVVELDKTLINDGGDVVAVWASTHVAN